jgi:hypothetical protein
MRRCGSVEYPRRIPGHFSSICCNNPVREAFEHQAAQDWEAFLTLRSRELRPGGRPLVMRNSRE